jgi:NADPH2:quinone reductase
MNPASGAMRAVVIREPGGPEVLELREVPLPEPGRGEVRVRVSASGLNRADLLQRRGAYPAPPGWPADIPGLEFSGTVEAFGEGAQVPGGPRVGQRVMGIVGGGGCAETVVTHAHELVPVPGSLSLTDAGAVPEVFITAFDALFLQMSLRAGETLLVHAVGSGVGTAALQLARAAGARVIGTSRTAAKLARAKELGLDEAVHVEDAGWPARVLELTGGRGADVILDLVGGPYLAGSQKALAHRGRMILVGVTGGGKAELDLRALLTKRASITGTVLRSRSPEEKVEVAREFTARVVPLLASGAVRPVVDQIYRPEQVAEAHARLEADDTFGKLLLDWS